MHIQESPDLNPPVAPGDAESDSGKDSSAPAEPAPQTAAAKGMLGNHKGKLAVGAAAMLGLAVYYKWRESKLAKEDPAEYARIQRLKAVLGSGDPKPGKTDTPPDRSDEG